MSRVNKNRKNLIENIFISNPIKGSYENTDIGEAIPIHISSKIKSKDYGDRNNPFETVKAPMLYYSVDYQILVEGWDDAFNIENSEKALCLYDYISDRLVLVNVDLKELFIPHEDFRGDRIPLGMIWKFKMPDEGRYYSGDWNEIKKAWY